MLTATIIIITKNEEINFDKKTMEILGNINRWESKIDSITFQVHKIFLKEYNNISNIIERINVLHIILLKC